MWLKWLPWRFLIKSFARGRGFLDPLALLSALRRFSPPSEVGEPIELLRAGVLFHARGLINTKAIQHNLDWIWPYWVERQFNPHDQSFMPRAFSITHVNLTHRNWTAMGLPACDAYALVDPRGLVTCHYDGWSLDFWIFRGGAALLPSRTLNADQRLELHEEPELTTCLAERGMSLCSRVAVCDEAEPSAVIKVSGSPTYNHRWFGTSHGKSGIGFSYDKTAGAATTMRAVAKDCANEDSANSGRALDGNRVKPNGDNREWSY